MATVYLVSSGEYSAYTVDAIFTTREKAQAYIDRFPEDRHNDIAEFDLDPDLPPPIPAGLKRFQVRLLDNEVVDACEWEEDCANHGERVGTSWAYVYARDKEHAKKIGIERIQAEQRRKAFEPGTA